MDAPGRPPAAAPRRLWPSLAIDGPDLYAGAQDSGDYHSADSAASWKRMAAGVDKPLVVRLDLASSRYANPYSGVFFGWEVSMGPEAKEYTLELSNLTLPTWAKTRDSSRSTTSVSSLRPRRNGKTWAGVGRR